MKQRKDGDKIIVDGRVATVQLGPAKASGLQCVTFDHVDHWLFRAVWLPWQEIAKCPDAPREDAQP